MGPGGAAMYGAMFDDDLDAVFAGIESDLDLGTGLDLNDLDDLDVDLGGEE